MGEPKGMHLAKSAFVRTLYFRVIIAIVLGVFVGLVAPDFAAALKPLGDAFIKLIRVMIAPVIFLTVMAGIAEVSDVRKLGRVGLKALLYFEAVTSVAMLAGYAAVKLVKPGASMGINPATLDVKSVAQYATNAKHLNFVDFLLNIIPDTFVSAFATGEMLQVLLLALLTGLAMLSIKNNQKLLEMTRELSTLWFRIINIVMELAPIGAFGAMAFTIGKYGIHSLLSLGKLLLCVYGTCIFFVVLVLGSICLLLRINLWKLLSYIREEMLIVVGTSSSEPALPGIMRKLEHLGCSRAVTGLVIPGGYSFNLDGTSIYLTISALFIAQALGIHLSFRQEALILAMLMINSKGAATVAGGGFITLAATLPVLGIIPVAGIALLLGVDRFMSQCRSLTNLIGNTVATIAIAKWENEFDHARAIRVLNGEHIAEETLVEASTG